MGCLRGTMHLVVTYVDYFAAISDDVAVAMIERSGDSATAFDTVRTEVGPEMVVALEELLTGVSYQDNTPDLMDGRILVSHDDDDLFLLTVVAEAQVALAEADGRRLAELATRWSQVEELTGQHNDSEMLLRILRDLQGLARRAIDRGERLYCWMCA
jgi:hypothetical protein